MEVTVKVIVIVLQVKVTIKGPGIAEITQYIDGEVQPGNGDILNVEPAFCDVVLGAEIEFTATPIENYGLIKYAIQNIPTYMQKN